MTDSAKDNMQAIVVRGSGYAATATGPLIEAADEWLELRTLPVPKLSDGQALIKVRTASVNPSDVHFIKGEYGQPRVGGAVAGFEGCGDVIDGPAHLLGQRVAFVAGPDGSGAWAEYAVADANACIPLRPEISDADGAAQIVNPLTARAMMGMAKSAGDAVIITAGNAQLGKLMIGLAADMGVKVITTVRRAEAAAQLHALGADRVLCTADADFAEQARAAIAQCKPRMMLDAVCDTVSEQLFVAMPNRARWVCYGKLSTELPTLTQMGQLIFMSKQIEGFWLTNWFRQTELADQITAIQDVQARFADGRWSTDVSATLRLDEVIDRLATALKTPGGKTMIEVSGS